MKKTPLYPLRFVPVCQYRLWGGRRLAALLAIPLPGTGPIGEAWLLSDRPDHASCVAEGALEGQTITQLMEHEREGLLGKSAGQYRRFPLLLKFLDASAMLSVQVHPTDADTDSLPPGETGKTEAWVVLQAEPNCRIYAGLKPGTTAAKLRQALADETVAELLPSFTPEVGDGVYLPAGTVHSLGDGVVVFEVQQNSDVTFRLYDWARIDAATGQPRELQIDRALACIDFAQGAIGRVTPQMEETAPVRRERLFAGEHFTLWRLRGERPFTVGAPETARVVVCVEGQAQLDHLGTPYAIRKGEVLLLPAAVGACACRPNGPVTLLEIALPEAS